MGNIKKIIKDKLDEIEKNIKDAKTLIAMGKELGIDTTEHEINLSDAEEKVKKLKKRLEESE